MELIKNFMTKFINQLVNFLEVHILHRADTIGWYDIVDILFLSLIFYFILKFIVQRRAARLFIGIVIVAIIMFISLLFNLEATSYVLKSFYQVGFIAIIIVFQPEIRAALEKIGNAPITIKSISSDNKSSSYATNSIGIIVKTACDLSESKTGAIIVIERETKLGEHIKTGTFINAQLSSQLLKNIFFNKAPLHDGAVILRNYRLYAAGCFLPLTANEDIDENMGTRHRAAIGISEVSDAVALVVSEETGNISICVDGELLHGFNQKSLRKELNKLLLPNNTKKTPNKNKNQKENQKED